MIMDGNGRWAAKRHLPRVMGHQAGIKAVRAVVKKCCQLRIEALTLYAFSTENWQRPKEEVATLMRFLEEYLVKEQAELMEQQIRFNAIGRLEQLPASVQRRLREVMEATKHNPGLVLTLALNYSGRAEIVDAAKRFAQAAQRDPAQIERLDERGFARYLYTTSLPDPDLLIRTSGEMRVSNFLLWQISYSELVVTPKLWPDFRGEDLEQAIAEYRRRERRFGQVSHVPASSP